MNWTQWHQRRQHLNELLDWAAKVSLEKRPKTLPLLNNPLVIAMGCIDDTIAKLEAQKAERVAFYQATQAVKDGSRQ